MNAGGYIYQGHDFRWKHCGSRVQDILWPLQASKSHEVSEAVSKAEENTLQYQSLLDHGHDLSKTTVEFRNSMSHSFDPMLCWIPTFGISDESFNIPPLLKYHAPDGHQCTHCGGILHEEYRCYNKDPRNMYRYPPNKGWPNGTTPLGRLIRRPTRTDRPTLSHVASPSIYMPSPSPSPFAITPSLATSPTSFSLKHVKPPHLHTKKYDEVSLKPVSRA
jgi:hypothetical protein